MNEQISESQASPAWSTSTKTVVGLALAIVGAWLILEFMGLVGPLLLAFVLAYLLHPVACALDRRTKLNWTGSVALIYIVVALVVFFLVLMLGVSAIEQGAALSGYVDGFAEQLPAYADRVPDSISLLSYTVDLGSRIEEALEGLSGNLGQAVQTSLDLIVGFAAGAVAAFGWSIFALLVSLFVLQSAGPNPSEGLNSITVPGYGHDIRRFQRELKRIWRAYLGGLITLSAINFFAYLLVLWILGVESALALAILAAVARFIPYVGAFVAWAVTALVVLFQQAHPLGLSRWEHVVIVLVVVILIDQALDQFLTPKIMGQALGVHPAAVMVAVIVAAGLIGPVGLILASPVLASVWLITRYTGRKMLDVDPWPDPEIVPESGPSLVQRLRSRGE